VRLRARLHIRLSILPPVRPGARAAAIVAPRGRPVFGPGRAFGGFLAGLGQQRVEAAVVQAFQGAEIGARQRAAFERAQQQGALAPALLLGFVLLALCGLRFTLGGLFGGAAFFDDGAAPSQFGGGGFAVFSRQFAGWLAFQVETLRLPRQRQQVGRARRVAVQETTERLAREHARRARLDVGLNAQLQGQRLLQVEQGREKLTQARRALGRRQVGRCHGGIGCIDDTSDSGDLSDVSETGDTGDVSEISEISDPGAVSDGSAISDLSDTGDTGDTGEISDPGDVSKISGISGISNIRIDWRAFVGRRHGQRFSVLRSSGLQVGHGWRAEQDVLAAGFDPCWHCGLVWEGF